MAAGVIVRGHFQFARGRGASRRMNTLPGLRQAGVRGRSMRVDAPGGWAESAAHVAICERDAGVLTRQPVTDD
jgi:hypothetical protein